MRRHSEYIPRLELLPEIDEDIRRLLGGRLGGFLSAFLHFVSALGDTLFRGFRALGGTLFDSACGIGRRVLCERGNRDSTSHKECKRQY